MKIGQLFLALRDVADRTARRTVINETLTAGEQIEALRFWGIENAGEISTNARLDILETILLTPTAIVRIYDTKLKLTEALLRECQK
jgi:hypothetical protein